MTGKIKTNVKVNFKFYRRNRLLIVASIITIGILSLSAIPMLLFATKTKHLQLITMIFSQLSSFATVVTAGLGLLFMSYHVRSRATKMVFTKPCSPGVWLFAGILSASLVALVFYAAIFLLCSMLFFVWKLPFQWGILYLTINEFLQAVIILSVITFLTVLFHPVVAVLVIFILQEGTFYYLKLLMMSSLKSTGEGWLFAVLTMAKWFVDALYMGLPTYQPFAEKMSSVYASFRVSADSWNYLLMACAYAGVACSLFYVLSLHFLKNKRHI